MGEKSRKSENGERVNLFGDLVGYRTQERAFALLRSALRSEPRAQKVSNCGTSLLMRGFYVCHATCDRLLEPGSSRELRYRARRQLKSGAGDDDGLLGARRLRVCKRILGTPPPLSQLEI